MLLRLWIIGYRFAKFVDMVCICVEFRRRMSLSLGFFQRSMRFRYMNLIYLLPLSFIFFTITDTKGILTLPQLQSQPLNSFKVNESQNVRNCSYTIPIRTSCSSTTYIRDQISLLFGDAYGNQVYAPRIDDPRSKTFERCSTDTFQIKGPCTYQVCYLYLYKSGYGGWKPESVVLQSYYTKTDTFYFNVFIPNGIWYGYNSYNGRASTST